MGYGTTRSWKARRVRGYIGSEPIQVVIERLLMGAFIFLLISNPAILDPGNTEWLYGRGDSETHYLGFAYFIRDDWRVPVGINPSYGLLDSSSIVYTDSIPILSIVTKLAVGLFPISREASFQLFGLYTLLAMQLLYLLSYIALRHFTRDKFFCYQGAFLVSLIPIPAYRLMPEISHISLTSCYVVVASIVVYLLRPPARSLRIFLLVFSFGIHPYLGVITFTLWLGSLCDLIRLKKFAVLKELFVGLFLLTTLMYMYGYFGFGFEVDKWGYGFFGWNLYDIFDSTGFDLGSESPINSSFSRLLGSLVVDVDEQWESFTYLGVGVLLALVLGTISLVRLLLRSDRTTLFVLKTRAFTVASILILLLLSITHEIRIGHDTFYLASKLYIPKAAIESLVFVRASARLAWPFVYTISIASLGIIGIFASKVNRTKRFAISLVMSALVLIQIYDLSPGHAVLRSSFEARSGLSALVNKTSQIIVKSGSRRLFMLIDSNKRMHYLWLAQASQNSGIPTNVVYSARPLKDRQEASMSNISPKDLGSTLFAEPIKSDHQDLNVCQRYKLATSLACHEESVGGVRLFWFTRN